MQASHEFSPDEWLALHRYQHDGSHKNPNECTLCSMTMLLDWGAKAAGMQVEVNAALFGKELDRIPFRHPRFPACFPGPGGATHPRAALKGMQHKIRQWRKNGHSYPFWPVLKKHQSPEDLARQMKFGHPTLIYGVGKTGIPHVVVPIARGRDDWQILDPGYPTQQNPKIWSDEQLIDWWCAYSLFYPRGTMISLLPDQE